MDRLPLEILFRIFRQFLDARSRVCLRRVSRSVRAAVEQSYRAQTWLCDGPHMDLIECMDSAMRLKQSDVPGRVRLFYVYRPDIFCADMLACVIAPEKNETLPEAVMASASLRLERRFHWMGRQARGAFIDAFFELMRESGRHTKGFARALIVFKALVWSGYKPSEKVIEMLHVLG